MSETKHTPLPWRVDKDGQILTAKSGPLLPEYIPLCSPWKEDAWVANGIALDNAQLIVTSVNAHERLEADSKKLREPATCNAGHKSNLPVALWDCPVCTQLLRDRLQKVEELVTVVKEYTEHAAKPPWESGPFDHDFWLVRAGKAIREVEAALGGKAE